MAVLSVLNIEKKHVDEWGNNGWAEDEDTWHIPTPESFVILWQTAKCVEDVVDTVKDVGCYKTKGDYYIRRHCTPRACRYRRKGIGLQYLGSLRNRTRNLAELAEKWSPC